VTWSFDDRNLASETRPEWKYIPVRHVIFYTEQNMYRGNHCAVFEPPLIGQVKG
jgi:hypothetical protein